MILAAVKLDTVATPLADSEAVRRSPVTLAEFITSAPATEVVRLASVPSTIVEADGPKRSTPEVEPVPASRTKSPPTELLSPDA